LASIKGNEWAWQNRRWKNIEQFWDTQNVWINGGLVLIVLNILAHAIAGLASSPHLLVTLVAGRCPTTGRFHTLAGGMAHRRTEVILSR